MKYLANCLWPALNDMTFVVKFVGKSKRLTLGNKDSAFLFPNIVASALSKTG